MKPAVVSFVVALGAMSHSAAASGPISIPEQLKTLSAAVVVEELSLTLPSESKKAEVTLESLFFQHPILRTFSSVTTADWRTKWDILGSALVNTARQKGLDYDGLTKVLTRINRGRNERSHFTDPPFVARISPPGLSEEARATFEAANAAENERLKVEHAKKTQDELYDDRWAVIPVAAFYARHSGGVCWIVLCTWEYQGQRTEMTKFGHVCLWAVDRDTGRFLLYFTCD